MKIEIKDYDLYGDNTKRNIYIGKGKNFDSSDEKVVLIFHDGQNIFDATKDPNQSDNDPLGGAQWGVERVLNEISIDNALVIGVSHMGVERAYEYSPFRITEEKRTDWNMEDKFYGVKYVDALKNKLIPEMEKEYNFDFSKANTLMLGSSFGGVITTYAAKKYPELFNGYIAMSNALHMIVEDMWQWIEKDNKLGKYFNCMGGKEYSGAPTDERSYINSHKRMCKYLVENEVLHMSVYEPTAAHSSVDWHRRLGPAILWGLKK